MPHPRIDYTEEYDPYPQLGIGIVGAGTIVQQAHLPAYEMAGFNVQGITDTNQARADTVADRYDIASYEDLEEMLNDEGIDVVDIAVPAQYQLDIVRKAVTSGRHVLCQKPLSDDFQDAKEIVRLVDDAGITAAVNQQFRWEKSIRTVRKLLDDGALGTPLRGRFDFAMWSDWNQWIAESPRVDLLYFGIHYLDAFRYLFGEPERVYSSGARVPGQRANGETRTITTLEFDGELRANLDTNHTNWAEDYARFRFEGTDGIARGTVGIQRDSEAEQTEAFEFKSRSDGEWEVHEVESARFPDAFVGTMGSLLEGIMTDNVPMATPQDNLKTLQLVNAAYKSMREKRAISPELIDQDYYPPA